MKPFDELSQSEKLERLNAIVDQDSDRIGVLVWDKINLQHDTYQARRNLRAVVRVAALVAIVVLLCIVVWVGAR